MEDLGGAAPTATDRRRQPPPPHRLIGAFNHHAPPTAPSPALELSEDDIFNTPSDSSSSSSSSPTRPDRTRSAAGPNHTGILAALNDNARTRSGYDTRPVFNHKASPPGPATSSSSRMIPRKPPPPPAAERMRIRHQSAPVNVPVGMRRRDLETVVSEDEEETDGVLLPPHEVVAARGTPVLANSVLEGAGRTLKGRDLRQVRNAIWRKTGFLD